MLSDIYNTLQLLVQKVGELTAAIRNLQGISNLDEQNEREVIHGE